jgi:hypothetical protein
MSDGDPKVRTLKMRTMTRTLLIVNFALLLLIFGPCSGRQEYLAEKRLGIADVLTYASQFWFFASTFLSVVLFIWILVSRSEACRAQRPTGLDWTLFLGWIFAAAIVSLFAFITGLGG